MKQQGILGDKHIDLDGIRRVFSCLAWPYTSSAWAGVLLSLPFAVFALRLLLRESATPLDHLAFGIGLWAGAQACALAFDRHSEATSLASRYLPVLLFWPLMNVYSLTRLVADAAYLRPSRAAAALSSLLPAIAAGALIANTVKLAPASLINVAVAGQQHQMQAEHIARYVRLGDADALFKAGHMGLPYSNTQKLQSLLDDPVVRQGLPVNVRPAMVVKAEPQPSPPAFVPYGAYESVPRRDDMPGFGSRSEAGDAAVGQFRSEPLVSEFPFVRIDLAGYLPEAGLSLKLECADNTNCNASPVLPWEQARESWRGLYVRVPQTTFRIVAEDTSKSRWLAFTAPVEAGTLSVLSDAFVNRLRVDANIWISVICGVLALLLLIGIGRDAPLPANEA
jgi:branched-subunit amino acid ABC-type transport system permease component